MLEILALLALTRKIGKIVENKGYKPGMYKFLTCVLWFGGEIFGAILGAIISEGEMIPTYLIAILGAMIGAGTAYLIAVNRPERPLPQSASGTGKTVEGIKDVALEIYWKGAFVIMDTNISIFLDGVMIGSGSFVKGFSLQAQTTSGDHTVVLQASGRTTSTTFETEQNKKYRINLDYSRAWGKLKMSVSPQSSDSSAPVTT
jgi:hypothetical protein